MTRAYFLGVVLVLASASLANAAPPKDTTVEVETLRKKLNDDLNNTAALEAYSKAQFQRLNAIVDLRPDVAEKELNAMVALLARIAPDNEPSQQQIVRAKSTIEFYAKRIELGKTSVDELAKRIAANADDLESLHKLVMKVAIQVGPIVHTQPDTAAAQLKAARTVLEQAKKQAQQEATKIQIERSLQKFDTLDKEVATGRKRSEWGKKLTALIGSPAAPITAAAWVNGEPLAEADVTGKVILLTFFAVWADECIEQLPQLRKWHERHADNGLVIVGATKYYDFTWDETTKRAVRSSRKVTASEEEQMLSHFARHHELPYRFAVQSDHQLFDTFGAHAIPFVVLIDRLGKVRLVRIGSKGDATRDIEPVLAKLIAEKQ